MKEPFKVCMLVYNYWPYNVGGMEKQARRLIHALEESQTAEVLIVTARHSSSAPKSEKEHGSLIIRCAILQPIIGLILRFKDRKKASSDKTSELCAGEVTSGKGQEQLTLLAEKAVYWLNALTFMLTASVACFQHRKKIDIFHVQSTEWISGFAVCLGFLLKKPVISKEASYPPFREFEYLVPCNYLLNRLRYRGNYFTLTQSVADEVSTRVVGEGKVFIVPNGVDVPEEKATLGSGSTVLWVGNVSRGVLDKGLDVLVSAWSEVHKKNPDARLVMVGGGTLDLVRTLTEEHDVESSVKFPGYTSDIGSFYRNADVVVSSSRSEGMSNVLLEAQAWGIPIVASGIPGNRGTIVDESTGLLFPSEDSSAMAKNILQLLNDKDLRRKMGTKGRELMQNEYSIERTCERVVKAYRELLK